MLKLNKLTFWNADKSEASTRLQEYEMEKLINV